MVMKSTILVGNKIESGESMAKNLFGLAEMGASKISLSETMAGYLSAVAAAIMAPMEWPMSTGWSILCLVI